jgi:thiamine-monophosphate kinase
MAERLEDLGEWQLIERLGRFAPAGQFLDDAALLRSTGTLVVTSDVLVEGVHFSDTTTSAEDVGWRAAAANLSDLAAMGCQRGLGVTVALVAPGDTTWAWVEGVYQGLAAGLQAHGGVLLGGDCSSGNQRLLAVTALGELPRADAVIRRGAGRPGDWLVCSGDHGLSRLGLALLREELSDAASTGLGASLRQQALAAHQRPQPRFDAVRALQTSQPVGSPWRVAGTDSSDGLAAAARALGSASHCQALLDPDALPLAEGMASLPQAQQWCLAGGEDFQLVLALEPAWAQRWLQCLAGSRRIGELAPSTGREGIGWLGGQEAFPTDAAGFSHFSG